MRRIDRHGTDITDTPEKWQDTDWELVRTNHTHPSITTGMRPAGPGLVWVRRIGGEWISTGEKSFHRARQLVLWQQEKGE